MQCAIAFHSERGRRQANEDMLAIPDVFIKHPPSKRVHSIRPHDSGVYTQKGYLLLLADGVGGRPNGDIASSLVVKQVSERYYADPSREFATSLQRVIEATNRDLRQAPDNASKLSATTLTAALIHDNQLYVAHIGDSRAYLLRDGTLWHLTADHSVQMQTTRQPESVSQNNRVTRSVGGCKQAIADVWQWSLQDADRILLCSDGLSNYLQDKQIANFAAHPDLDKATQTLIDTAFDAQSTDNISLIIARVSL
jgi:protein phosphatase